MVMSLGVSMLCTSLYIRACVGESQEGSLGVTASQMLTLLHVSTP